LQNLRHFIDYVNLPVELQRDLQTTINHFAFVLTMFTKYEDLLNRLAIAGKADHLETYKSLGWLIFIFARLQILHKKNEIIECVCLLIAVISFMITHIPHTITYSKQFSKEEGEDCHQAIRKALCGIVKLKNIDAVILMEEALYNMIQDLKKADIIKTSNGEPNKFEGLFEGDRIFVNLKKLNSQYQQRLSPEEIDERIFLGNSLKN